MTSPGATALDAARSLPVIPRRHPFRAALAVLVVLLVIWWVAIISRNSAMEWPVIGAYFFHPSIMAGLWTTLWLTASVTALSVILGTVVAAMRLSGNYVLELCAWFYVWIFRSTPLLVQLLFWFNIGYLFPTISIGLPWGPALAEFPSRDVIGVMTAALLGLTLHTTSYAAEIIRGGLMAVPHGQVEAAEVLGLSSRRIFLRIVLPQSMRAIIPAIGNLLVDTLKSTSVISVLAVPDLLYSVQLIYNRTYKVVPLLMVATCWYIIITTLLSIAQFYIERHFARGVGRGLPETPLRRVVNGLRAALPARKSGETR